MVQGSFAADRLRSFIERIERLEGEKKDLAEDIKEVYAEAKGTGFDVATMRKIVKLRAIPDSDRREEALILETYMRALGMLDMDTVGEAAGAVEAQASEPPVAQAAE